MDKFFEAIEEESKISKTLFFWAYSDEKPSQKNWALRLQEKYKAKKEFYIYFKVLRKKWGKNKWNVDTEMGYYINEEVHNFDTMILFSWDGDFCPIIKDLVKNKRKRVFLFSTAKHTGAELYELEREISDASLYKIFDINSNKEDITRDLKSIIRWSLVLFPELMSYYKGLSTKDIQKNIQYIDDLVQWSLLAPQKHLIKVSESVFQDPFFTLKNSNQEYIYSIIKKWKKEDKERIIFYLKILI